MEGTKSDKETEVSLCACKNWRRRVGIEPDRRSLSRTSYGFEDRANHQIRCASANVANVPHLFSGIKPGWN